MKTAFIGNCSHSEAPIIDILHQEDFSVTSIGSDQSAAYSDKVKKHIYIDYTNKDLLGNFLDENFFDLYIPACNELFLKSIADLGLAEKFGLGSNALLKKIINKSWLSDAFRNCDVLKLARRKTVSADQLNKDYLEKFLATTPNGFLIKPDINAGGKGIVNINNSKDIDHYVYSVHNKSEKYVLEEVIHGVEYSFSTFIISNQVVGFFWDIELSNPHTKTIDASYWSLSTKPKWLEGVLDDIKTVVYNEKIQNGIFHLQIIEDNTKSPHVIDVTRRLSGDLYGNEVHFVTGFDLNKFYLSSLTNNIKYEFDFNLFRDLSKWKNFFRFVCIDRNSSKRSGEPVLNLSKSLNNLRKSVFPCVNNKDNKFNPIPGRRIYICHCYPDDDAKSYKDILLSHDLYNILWS